MPKRLILLILFFSGMNFFMSSGDLFASVIREGGRAYIVDRTGARWEVTQAESIGFKAEGFQFGLGKEAFTPLDDSSISEKNTGTSPHLRIIGVSEDEEAKAYSVPKLRGHEVANSQIGSKPIAAAY
jgi:hypothetical protein